MEHAHLEDNRQLISELAYLEVSILTKSAERTNWLTNDQETILRWALSLARISTVGVECDGKITHFEIGHATDTYRTKLFQMLKNGVDPTDCPPIFELFREERYELIELYRNRFSAHDLDEAICNRPLALALSGGGGTSYIFAGAFLALEEAGIYPTAIAGSSMGAIMGAYRARYQKFDIEHMRKVFLNMAVKDVVRPSVRFSKFSIPAALNLGFKSVAKRIFGDEDHNPRIHTLPIMFRATVAGLAHIEGQADPNLDTYAHLLDREPVSNKSFPRTKRITEALLDVARRPLRSIYLGGDELTRELKLIDAIGLSATVPGVFQYDCDDDIETTTILTQLMRREGVFRLLDGGFSDNLPSVEAFNTIQKSSAKFRDPFVLALDGFAPVINRNFMFMPMMQYAARNSELGRKFANQTIVFRKVPSPLTIVPTPRLFEQAVQYGKEEIEQYIPFLKKICSPLKLPIGIK